MWQVLNSFDNRYYPTQMSKPVIASAIIDLRHSSTSTTPLPQRRNALLYQAPKWRHFGTMAVNLSIKNAPDQIVQRLRVRGERHYRSLQGELMAILEDAVRERTELTPRQGLAEIRRMGVQTPSEAADIVRADRDGG